VDVAQPFGFKIAWLAVPSVSPSVVAEALALQSLRPAGWSEGVKKAYISSVFVTPPVADWTLVVSTRLPRVHQPYWTEFLEGTSRKLGEVQYFSTHRVVDLHVWAKASNGLLIRACAYYGASVLLNSGDITAEEQSLGFHFRQSTFPIAQEDASEDPDVEELWDDQARDLPDEQDVMSIAGKWSVDPMGLDADSSEGWGILGEAPPEW
jgi:hypothetical protein